MITKISVAIFREELLPYSETFISNQVKSMSVFEPKLLGLKYGTNKSSLPVQSYVMNESNKKIIKLFFRLFGSVPREWLDTVKQQGFKLVHAHFGPDALWVLPVIRRLGLPLLVTYHGYDVVPPSNGRGYFYKVYRMRRRVLYKQASQIIAVSKFIKDRLVDDGCPAHKIATIYIGIDTKKFSPSQINRELIVLYVGRLIEQKGVLDLIEVMKGVAIENPQVRLVIIGTGPMEIRARQEAQKNSLNCDFLGPVSAEEVRSWMNRAWLLCVPSRNEAFGLVYAESQAMHLPVVAYEHAGVCEAVQHGIGGLLAPPRNKEILAKYINKILNDRQTRDRLGEAGRLYVMSHFDIKIQTQKLESMYEQVIGKHYSVDNRLAKESGESV